MAAALRDLQRKISHVNANGEMQCSLVCIDLVEDRVKKRWTAVALLFSFFAPVLTYSCLGSLNTTWDRAIEPIPSVARDPFISLTAVLTAACTSEQRCRAESPAAQCSTDCLVLLSDAVTGGTAAPIVLTNATNVTNATSSIAAVIAPIIANDGITNVTTATSTTSAATAGNATAGNATEGSPTSTPTPTPPTAGTSADSSGTVWIAVIIFDLFVLVALAGNNTAHASPRWTYSACAATLLVFIGIAVAIRASSPLFLAWWPATFGALASYALLVAGLVLTAKGKPLPKLLRDHMKGDHSETKRQEARAYTHALLRRPPFAATVALRTGLAADGTTLTLAQTAELHLAVAQHDSQRYGHLAMLRAMISSMMPPRNGGGDVGGDGSGAVGGDAVSVPLRLQLAFVASLFGAVLLCNTIIRVGVSLKMHIDHLHATYVHPLGASVAAVRTAVADATGATMQTDDLSTSVQWIGAHLVSMGHACEVGATGGAVAALLVFIGAWLVVILDFRAMVLRARQGKLPYAPGSVPMRRAWYLVGTAIASACVAFALCALATGLALFALTWSLSQSLLGAALARYWGALVACLVLHLLAPIWMRLAESSVGSRHTIRARYWWMAIDFVSLFTQLFGGCVTAVWRVCLGVFGLLCGAARIDRPPYPGWLEAALPTDALVLAYRAAVGVCHQHSNPVLLVFVDVLSADARERRQVSDARREKPTSFLAQSAELNQMIDSDAPKLRVVARWRKAAFMVRNPLVGTAASAIVDEAVRDPQRHALEMPDRFMTITSSTHFVPPFSTPAPNRRAIAAGALGPDGASTTPAAEQTPEPTRTLKPSISTGTMERAYLDGQRRRLQAALGLSTPTSAAPSGRAAGVSPAEIDIESSTALSPPLEGDEDAAAAEEEVAAAEEVVAAAEEEVAAAEVVVAAAEEEVGGASSASHQASNPKRVEAEPPAAGPPDAGPPATSAPPATAAAPAGEADPKARLERARADAESARNRLARTAASLAAPSPAPLGNAPAAADEPPAATATGSEASRTAMPPAAALSPRFRRRPVQDEAEGSEEELELGI